MNSSSATATNLKSKKKKKLTPEIQLRLSLDECSQSKDLSAAISLFTSATTGDPRIRLNQHHCNSLLYICSNSLASGDPSRTDAAIQFGFRVYDHMLGNDISPSEATVTAVARLAAARDDGDAAFELAKSVGSQGRLRTYVPALLCYCRNGMDDKAFQVEEHMDSLGLRLEESELAALLELQVEKGNSDKVYEYLHKLRATVREVTGSTADVIEGWFLGNVASEVGLKVDVNQVKEVKLRNGGGWHGLGWLGDRKWVVQRSNVTPDGTCCACGDQLICVDVEQSETEHFAKSVASLAMEREAKSHFKEFLDWLEECDGYEAIVDGANVGLYQQNFADGGFSILQLNAVVEELYSRHKKWPLIILHKKRVNALLDDPSYRDTLQKWINLGVLYVTPYGSNDDWYWLYAAVKLECLLVTNDEMRDHIFELLGSSFFRRWKEGHLVKYTFSKGKLELLMPPSYSIVIQESATGSWHVPIAGEASNESLRTWLCITRSSSSFETLTNHSINYVTSEVGQLDCQIELCNPDNSEALSRRNNGDDNCKYTAVAGKRKERSPSISDPLV